MEKSGGPSVGPPQTSTGGSGDQAPKKPRHPPLVNRKRTKTGCLTCRKRRIKCDEGRPICNNCIKSKRHCEGYNQRVIFKDPIGAHPFAGPFGAQGYIQGAAHPLQLASQQARRPGTTGLPTIAPRPPAYDYYNGFPGVQYQNTLPPGFPGPAALQYDLNAGAYPPPPVDPYAQQRNPLAAVGPFPQSQLTHYLPPSNDDVRVEFQQPPQPQHYQQNLQDVTASQYVDQTAPGAFTTNVPPRMDQSGVSAQTPTSFVAQAGEEAYDWSDEDASIADSEDESGQHQGNQLMHVFQSLNRRGYHYGGPSPFSRSANDAALGQYMSTPHADELQNEAKRKLFEHFMRVTGPTMSLYERHPFDPAEKAEIINSSSHTPRETKGNNIWSHTFPMVSLQHPGLLHAMLALASLQVCHIQGTPATAAHKHYHLAIRRVAKNVKTQSRRLQPATLAATLLLAYFEVWNSEHTRWASHLYGARILFAEMSLRSMGRRCLPAQSLRARQAIAQSWDFSGMGGALPSDPNYLDYGLLTTITGFRVTPDDYNLGDAQILGQRDTNVTDKDIETFENLRDLFWWYCKMDVYQSMLGGTKLFMDYEHWTQCPPRAPVSKLGGIYGTYDHLMLLLGRLAHFASHDLDRKRRVSRAKGPPPGGSSPPPFPGMLPTGGTFRPPMGFSPPTRPHTMSDQQEDPNPQESYQRAVSEWEGIKEAFEVLGNSLGPDFKPLGREYADPGNTPFGESRQYRTFSVAGIWMNYYMGLIHLHRSHPNMPPTAMQSVGFAARTTAEFAKQVGRIAIGLVGDLSKATEVNTVLAAALVESAFCLFVAAVQYQDDAQRQWVVKWMHDITRLTGWKSARQIADGCESAWTKAAQLGKGPPYERQYEPHEIHHTEQSVWDNARRIDRVIQEIDYDGGANDRRIVVARAERAHYALGLLGVEDDLEYLELKDETFNRGPGRNGEGE